MAYQLQIFNIKALENICISLSHISCTYIQILLYVCTCVKATADCYLHTNNIHHTVSGYQLIFVDQLNFSACLRFH